MIKEGLRTALNNIRETSIVDNTLYARYVEEITPNTNIGEWSAPILENQTILNDRIIYEGELNLNFLFIKELIKVPTPKEPPITIAG